MNLAACGQTADALTELRKMPKAENDRDLYATDLLHLYLQLQNGTAFADLAGNWNGRLRSLSPETISVVYDSFFPLIYGRIGALLEEKNQLEAAFDAYRQAYRFAGSRQDAFQLLESMISCQVRMGTHENRILAAELAKQEFDLFAGTFASSPETRLRIARVLAGGKRGTEAREVLMSVLQNLPSGEVRNAFFEKALDALLSEELYEDAGAFVREIYPDSNSWEALSGRKKVSLASGYTENAMQLCRTMGDRFPEHRLESWREAADLAYQLRKDDVLMELADLILKMEPGDPVLFLRGVVFEAQGKNQQARADYLAYAEYWKSRQGADAEMLSQAFFRAGRTGMISGESDISAIAEFRTVFEKYPQSPLAPAGGYWLACLLLRQKDLLQGKQVCEQMTLRYPGSEEELSAYLKLAEAYRMAGRNGDALQALAHVEEVQSASSSVSAVKARALYEKAWILYSSGDPAGARESLDDMIAKFADDPHRSEAYYFAGDIAREQKQYSEAEVLYRKAMESRPGSPLELSALGSIGACNFALAVAAENPKESTAL